jgi:hypothetical protein
MKKLTNLLRSPTATFVIESKLFFTLLSVIVARRRSTAN